MLAIRLCANIFFGSKRDCLENVLKKDIHPEYMETIVKCSCGDSFKTRSTRPELHVEICSQCHPFYTGKQKLVDSGGRVERFQKRFASHLDVKEQRQKKSPRA